MSGGRSMSPVSEGLAAILAKYGAVLLGVGAGTAAKYKLTLSDGRKLTWGEVASDMLLVPMVVLVAAYVGAKLGAEPHLQAVLAAFFAVSSDRLIRILRERFIQRVAKETEVPGMNDRFQETQKALSELNAQVDEIKRGEK